MSVSVRLALYSRAWSFRVKMIIFEGVLVIILSDTAKCSAVITSLNNGVYNFVNYNSSMEPSSSKRCHVASGTTPNKPDKKRTRDVNSKIRKPLSFSLENVPRENESDDLVSPEIKMRSRCSPGFKVVSPGIKKSYLSSIKSPVRLHKWSFDEERALVEFVGLAQMDPKYGISSTSQWPAFRTSHIFWADTARHIRTSTCSSVLLNNARVRARLLNHVKVKFKTLEAAEEHYKLTLSNYLEEMDQSIDSEIRTPIKVVDKVTQTVFDEESGALVTDADTGGAVNLTSVIAGLDSAGLIKFANSAFLELAVKNGINSNPANFAELAVQAMKRLQEKGKSNLMYKFAMCVATNRPGSNDSLFPLDRMPFGLVEYQIEFFSATNIMQISVADDFRIWYETMCAEFPTRFSRLFRGPMWSGLSLDRQKDPLTARVNIASPSLRTVEKKTAEAPFTYEAEVQVEAIKELKKAHPNGRFWLKVDACDIKVALQESVKGKWDGDIDLGDGKLQEMRAEYDARRTEACIKDAVVTRDSLQLKICNMVDALKNDLEFLADGLKKADSAFQKKFNSPNASQAMLKALCWERVEYNTLLQQAQAFRATIDNLLTHLQPGCARVQDVASSLKDLQEDLQKYLRNLFVKKRQPAATHVLAILVSEERRNKKPYAIPVQFVPYCSIRDQYIRDVTAKVKTEMVKMDLKPVGLVTDGEFNSLRTQGETRPLHIWQLIHDARESVSKVSRGNLLKMLIQIGVDSNGNPVTEITDEAIPATVIHQLRNLQVVDGLTLEDAVTFVRQKLVPDGYQPYPFRADTPESFLDKLRSIVATCHFRYRVQELKRQGVDFSTFLYVPEVDPITKDRFHEREDHCHILKRIWKHTREGGFEGMNLQGFDEAMLDAGTGLTHASLTGERKQSVGDAERMLSFLVAKFLREHGYIREAKYIDIIAGWHEAADGRGLSELERCKRNYEMLNMILDEWIPWHKENPDLSTVDVNKPIKGICGFSRETVIAVTTNIESIEFRRRENGTHGFEEHPRAGTTDDVEAFFALLHRFLGLIFTLKEFKALWRKLVREFTKRIGDDLPFYYWTANERYREWEEELPSFNQAPDVPDNIDAAEHPLRLHRLTLSRREDSSIFTAGRSFLPARNQTTIRQRLHRPEGQLPPNL